MTQTFVTIFGMDTKKKAIRFQEIQFLYFTFLIEIRFSFLTPKQQKIPTLFPVIKSFQQQKPCKLVQYKCVTRKSQWKLTESDLETIFVLIWFLLMRKVVMHSDAKLHSIMLSKSCPHTMRAWSISWPQKAFPKGDRISLSLSEACLPLICTSSCSSTEVKVYQTILPRRPAEQRVWWPSKLLTTKLAAIQITIWTACCFETFWWLMRSWGAEDAIQRIRQENTQKSLAWGQSSSRPFTGYSNNNAYHYTSFFQLPKICHLKGRNHQKLFILHDSLKKVPSKLQKVACP